MSPRSGVTDEYEPFVAHIEAGALVFGDGPTARASPATRFARELLALCAAIKDDARIIRVSLTVPPTWWDAKPAAAFARLRDCVVGLTGAVAGAPGEGAWICLDVAPNGRPHVFGVLLTRAPESAAAGHWQDRVGGTHREHVVPATPGDVGRVVKYALMGHDESKPKGPPIWIEAHERAIATGALRAPWTRALLGETALPGDRRGGSKASTRPSDDATSCLVC